MIVDSRLSQLIMHAVFHQPLPCWDILPPFKNLADLLHGLRSGWVYSEEDAQQLVNQFGRWDLDYRESGAGIMGLGVVVWTPDGVALERGEDLVAWRDQRWARMRAEGLREVMGEVKQGDGRRVRL